MKFTSAFNALALSFAAVIGSADARIGQQMSSDAFELRMMSGTEDCGMGCCDGQLCDPSAAVSCGAGIPRCDAYMETCTLQHPSGEYRCQSDFNGRKLGGDPTSTPGSTDAPIGQQMSCGEFEVECDANLQALGVNCALLSCVDCTPLLVDSGVNCTPDAFKSRMMSGTQDDCGNGCCLGQICDPSSAMSCGAAKQPQCEPAACTLQTPSGEYRCQWN